MSWVRHQSSRLQRLSPSLSVSSSVRCASEGTGSGYHPAAQRRAQGRGDSWHGAPAVAVNQAAA